MNNMEVGISGETQRLLGNLKPGKSSPTWYLYRYSGMLVWVFVLYLLIVNGGGNREQLAGIYWLLSYAGYIGILELSRKFLNEHYDKDLFKIGRISANLIFISWIVKVTPDVKDLLSFLYLIPIFSTSIYFPQRKRFKIAVFGFVVVGFLLASNPGSFQLGEIPLEEFTILGFLLVFLLLMDTFFGTVIVPSLKHFEFTIGLHQKLDLTDISKEIMDYCLYLSKGDYGLLIIVDPGKERYVHHENKGFNLREGKTIAQLANKCLVIKGGTSFYSSDVEQNFNNKTLYNQFFTNKIKTIFAEPILSRENKIIGVISIGGDSHNEMDRFAPVRIRRLGAWVGAAIENTLNLRDLELVRARTRKINENLSGSTKENELAKILTEEAIKLIPSAQGCVFHKIVFNTQDLERIVSINNGELIVWESTHIDPNQLGKTKMKVGSGIAGQAVIIREPIRVPDVDQHPWFDRSTQDGDLKSLLVAPLFDLENENPIGVISLHSPETGAFERKDEINLEALAHHGAIAFTKIRAFSRWRKRGGLIKQIHDEVRKFDKSKGEGYLCNQIVEAASKNCGFQIARIRLLDSDSQELVTFSTAGVSEDEDKNSRGLGIPLSVIRDLMKPNYAADRSFLIPHDDPSVRDQINMHFTVEPEMNNQQTGWKAYNVLLTPIYNQAGEIFGILTFDKPLSGTLPTPDQIESIGVFASAVEATFDSMRSRNRLIEQHNSTMSFITSIPNAITDHSDIETFAEFVVQIGGKLLSAEGCSLHLVKGNELELTHSNYQTDIGRKKPISNKPKSGLSGYVAATGETLIFANKEYESHHAWAEEREHLEQLPSKDCISILIVPIKNKRGEVIGVINLENKKKGEKLVAFAVEDRILLMELANQVASALEIIERYSKIEKWERKGLEDDLHDLINWYHSGVVLYIEAITKWVELGKQEKANELLIDLRSRALTTMHELKTIHTSITSKYLETENLRDGFEKMVEAWSLRVNRLDFELSVDIDCPYDLDLPIPLKNTLLRIGAGALGNSIKYSGIIENPEVEIKMVLKMRRNHIIFYVFDNGVGEQNLRYGYGLNRMQSLIGQLKKDQDYEIDIDIFSHPDTGTKVTVSAFLNHHESNEKVLTGVLE